MLVIESKKDEKTDDKDGKVLHKGISKDTLKSHLQYSDDVEVKGV